MDILYAEKHKGNIGTVEVGADNPPRAVVRWAEHWDQSGMDFTFGLTNHKHISLTTEEIEALVLAAAMNNVVNLSEIEEAMSGKRCIDDVDETEILDPSSQPIQLL